MLLALLVNIAFTLALVAAMSSASALLGPQSRLQGDKGLPYETGLPPLGAGADKVWVSYFRFAVLFVVFDVDLAFLIPWILLRDSLTLAHMISMSVFFGLVGLAWAYVWSKGALECR